MDRTRVTIPLLIASMLLTAVGRADDEQPASKATEKVPRGTISVRLNGALFKTWTHEKDVNGGKPVVTYAAIKAGGTSVRLDWKDCPVVHAELAAYHHGGGFPSAVYAEVSGQMIFKPENELPRIPIETEIEPSDELIPVVLVETLHIRVEPRSTTQDRNPVRSTTVGVNQE